MSPDAAVRTTCVALCLAAHGHITYTYTWRRPAYFHIEMKYIRRNACVYVVRGDRDVVSYSSFLLVLSLVRIMCISVVFCERGA